MKCLPAIGCIPSAIPPTKSSWKEPAPRRRLAGPLPAGEYCFGRNYYRQLDDPTAEDGTQALPAVPFTTAWDRYAPTGGQQDHGQALLQQVAELLAPLGTKIDALAAAASPILTKEQAAALLGVSTKRLSNVISKLKRETGKQPDFVCDGGGNLGNRFDHDKLVEWARHLKRRRGRPRKVS
jgi:hypothetical protein